MGVKCFLLEPTDRVERRLRRYVLSAADCPGSENRKGFHNANVIFDYVQADGPQDVGLSLNAESAKQYVGWPTKCSGCDYQFQDGDSWQVSTDHVFKRSDTGEELVLNDAPPGAMWNAYWFASRDHEWTGPDGRTIEVVCPNGVRWNIDSRANNCDSPCENCGAPWNRHDYEKCAGYKDAKPHKCWIRQGEPPLLTVGKEGGPTCGAGAGSIQAGDYHGFLRNGEFDP